MRARARAHTHTYTHAYTTYTHYLTPTGKPVYQNRNNPKIFFQKKIRAPCLTFYVSIIWFIPLYLYVKRKYFSCPNHGGV